MAHPCNPNTLVGKEDRRLARVQKFKTSVGNTVRPRLYRKTKIGLVGLTPIILALWEAEAGRSLEPRVGNLGNTVKPHLHKNTKN